MPATHALGLLAEITVQTIGGGLAALLIGAGVFWALILLMVRGFWDKTGKPAIKALITELLAEPETVKKRTEELHSAIQAWHNAAEQSKTRTDEVQSVIQTWHNAPEQLKTRTEFVKGVIDNEVRRDDGVIHKDITTKVDALEADLAKKIDGVATKFDKFQEAQERRDKENREFNAQVLAKLARIEGAFQTMSGRRLGGTSGESFANLPAQRPPKVGGGGGSPSDD